ncbi:DUF1902 domain-containing protein [Roseixanthobacter glucoisosaccharinicivorans]|uniref:DUF1902 domain-containing protein n=1 Tax=Roseixanthobacter glucoisosaccharinicivorans TaxID=3119923 RepID=UPI00372AAF66
MDMENVINVDIQTHRETGLILATSDDMPGLYVHARSFEELERRLPIAIRDILEFKGNIVESVDIVRRPNSDPFMSPHFTISAIAA